MAGLLFTEQGYMKVKAILADRLIEAAWEAHRLDGGVHRPWAWADTHPLARLEVERLGIRRTILSGASGTSMAFGIGHVDGTALPNRAGNVVLGGHRDGRFAFLEHLRPGDRMVLTTHEQRREWVVRELFVVDANDGSVLEDDGSDRLTLVTCFPFGGVTPTHRRYVVTASPATRPRATLPPASARIFEGTGVNREVPSTTQRCRC